MKVVAYQVNAEDTIHVDAFHEDGTPTDKRPKCDEWVRQIYSSIEMTEHEHARASMFGFDHGDKYGVVKFKSGAFISVTRHILAV